MMGLEIKAEIQRRLNRLSGEENIRTLLAVESGSRAWGFASADSDYDVRFLCLLEPDWYLSINLESRRDVIERPIVDEIDLSGRDTRKALKLMRKSNPPLLEWLDSPIIYYQDEVAINQFKTLVPHCHSATSLRHHYLRMAQITADCHLRKDRILHKKYFYALRPLLALRWLEQRTEPVPMAFQTLREQTDLNPRLDAAIDDLLMPAASTRRSTCQSVSGKARATPAGRASRSSGQSIPLFGLLMGWEPLAVLVLICMEIVLTQAAAVLRYIMAPPRAQANPRLIEISFRALFWCGPPLYQLYAAATIYAVSTRNLWQDIEQMGIDPSLALDAFASSAAG